MTMVQEFLLCELHINKWEGYRKWKMLFDQSYSKQFAVVNTYETGNVEIDTLLYTYVAAKNS